MSAPPSRSRGWLPVVAAVLVRPGLWFTALRQAVRLVPSRWWRQHPPLPRPTAEYVAFRTTTSSGGDGAAAPDAGEVVAWLRWSKAWPAAVGAR